MREAGLPPPFLLCLHLHREFVRRSPALGGGHWEAWEKGREAPRAPDCPSPSSVQRHRRDNVSSDVIQTEMWAMASIRVHTAKEKPL